MEKRYERSKILCLEYGTHLNSSQICIAFFSIYGGSDIWQDLEYAGRVTVGVNYLYSYSSRAKISFLKMRR